MKTVPLLHILESYFGIKKKIQKEVALVFGGDEDGEEGPSGSVSHVIAQENDVVCRKSKRNQRGEHRGDMLTE